MIRKLLPLVGFLILRAFFVFGEDVPWPMKVGTSWVYSGTVRGDWATADVVRNVRTTLRVEDNRHVGRYEIARISGGPHDVACSPEEKPITWYWVRDGNRFYEIHGMANTTNEEELTQELETSIPLVEWPMHGRESIGCETPSEMGCWSVEEQKGQFVLLFRTNPEHEIVYFKPGTGITRYIYSHHGSPCDIDLKLVKMRK